MTGRETTPETVGPGARLGAMLRRPGTVLRGLFAVGLLAWPLVYHSQYALNVMATAGLYAILTISVSLVIGNAGLLSFGHSAFYGIGAYTASLLAMRVGVPTLLALCLGALASGLVALLVGRPVLRLRYFYLALATIALGQIMLVLVTQLRSTTGGQNGLAPIPPLDLLGLTTNTYLRKYYVVWVVVLLILFFTQRALHHRTGRSLRALATSDIAASTLGVRTANWKLLAFAVSAVFCGIAGGLFAFNNGAVTPESFSFNAAVLPVIMMILGGAESLWGGVLGAIILTWALNAFSGALQYSGLIYSVLLVLLLLFLPNGVVQGVTGLRLDRLVRALVRATGSAGASGPIAAAPEDPGSAAVSGSPPLAATDPPPTAAGGPPHAAVAGEPLAGPSVTSGVPLLAIEDVCVDFGGLRAVNHVSLAVCEGQIAALIGPNGAGKTTLFNVVSHLQRPSSGQVVFNDVPTTSRAPAEVARLGLARTFQNLRVFGNMSVMDNVLVGCHRHERSTMIADGLGLPGQRREERESEAQAREALALVGLESFAERPVASLPYGRQRLVEIARALASRPRLLLLDEPAAGMNASERASLVEKIARIRDAGVTVLLVEHDIELVMGISDVVSVLDHGTMIAHGSPEAVRRDPAVIEAYLGVHRDDRSDTGADRGEAEAVVAPRPGTAGGREAPPALSVDALCTYYGPIQALRDVSFSVAEGETTVVLGANGAGKTTLLRTISGILTPSQGRITFRGSEIARRPAAHVAARGICHVLEGRQLFPTLSVEDNLLLGTANRRRRDGFADDLATIYDMFPVLAERRKQEAGSLSGGEQQMVAIGRALTGRPSLLLLDEPSMGLAPLVVEHIFAALKQLNDRGLTILMVEQNAEMALGMADHAVVLQTGEVALAGAAADLRRDPRVRESYLGQS